MTLDKKFKWYLLLFLDLGLFLLNLSLQNVGLSLLIIVIVAVIYRYGSPILFKEYDDKRKRKLEESQEVRKAANQVLASGEFLKKKKQKA